METQTAPDPVAQTDQNMMSAKNLTKVFAAFNRQLREDGVDEVTARGLTYGYQNELTAVSAEKRRAERGE